MLEPPNKINKILLAATILFGQFSPALSNSAGNSISIGGYQEQELLAAGNLYFAADFDDEWDDEEDFWDDDDEFWDDDNDFYDDEEEVDDDDPDIAPKAPRARATKEPSKPNQPAASAKPAPVTASAKPEVKKPTKEDLEIEEKIKRDLEAEKHKKEMAFVKLANTFKRTRGDFERLYSQYGDMLSGLDPANPKDLAEIEKLIEIVGVPKKARPTKQATKKKAKKTDPIVNFSARSIPVRDAFATLARVSGKSITVSGQINERDTVSVVEINDQPFTKAFLSLVQAADVDFSVAGDNYTILKKRGARKTSLSSTLDVTDIDLDLPLDDRYADLIYDNEDLSSIIKDVANKYGVDVVMTANPTERITLRVRGVNIEDAFELIFSGSQFSYTRKSDTFVVYSAANKNFSLDKKTVLFPLKYLEAQEAQKLLPAELKNLVQVSENQNAFIAEGSKAELTKLYDFLRTIDKQIPQVELNVKLVEVSKNFARANNIYQSPISLGRLSRTIDGATRGLNFDFDENEIGLFNERPTYNQNSGNSEIKVNQRLLVTSGKSAKINFDQDVNVVLNSGEANNQGAGVVQNQRIQRITAGNSMDITPIVGGGGVVTVKVDIEVSANDTPDANTGVPPRTIRRRISSEIQISDNETIAIGGLFDNRKTNSNTGELPLLSKIPVIGSLFGNNSKSKDMTELIILITPHVRDGDETEEKFIKAHGGI